MRLRATTALALAAIVLAPLAALPAFAAPAQYAAAPEQRLAHISVLSVGRGEPVILIPGLSTPRAVWEEFVPAIAKDHRVLLVQVNGFGGDDAGANGKDGMIDGIVADLHAYLREHQLGPARVIGHSLGGLVAMKLALAYPSAVDRLMIVDALPFFGTVMADSATIETMRPIAATMRSRMLAAADTIRARAATPVTSDPGGDMSRTPEGRIKVANWSMKADPAAVGQAVYEDMLTDLRKDIAGIEAPMTVLHNGASPLNARVYARDYSAQPKAKLVAIPDSAHFIMLDQPRRFAGELATFLR